MKPFYFVVVLLGGGLLFSLEGGRAADPTPAADAIQWQAWSPDVFTRAQAQHRLVLLDLEAVWCHWCHVMDEKTYHDPAIIREINEHFIAVRVDQDSRPDLSNRYANYGWPATILFASDGRELAKRQGYLPPEEMGSILEAFVKDPTPGPSVEPPVTIAASTSSSLAAPLRAQLQKAFDDNYDAKAGGWGFGHKFLEWNSVEYAMTLAQKGDAKAAQRAQETLAKQVDLIDPVWGGVYQYSTDGDWTHQHFEKLTQFQAENMRIYALAHALWPQGGYLKQARDIERYVDAFLASPDGAFYTSQDADVVDGQHSADYFTLNDAARRKQGVPRIDTHIYARENGWMIEALVALSNAAHDPAALKKAKMAAAFIMAHQGGRRGDGGGFRHGVGDAKALYLGDTLAMGQALLSIYGATGDRYYLTYAGMAAGFIERNFRSKPNGRIAVGYVTAISPPGSLFPAEPLADENVSIVRFANLLAYYSGQQEYRNMAQFALSFLLSPAVIKANGNWTSGLLLADAEFNTAPLHVTIVGPKDDFLERVADAQFNGRPPPVAPSGAEAENLVKTRDLFSAALALPGAYKQTEWLDRREGPLPSSAVEYPQLSTPAAFVCGENTCSLPLSTPDALRAFAQRQKAGPLQSN